MKLARLYNNLVFILILLILSNSKLHGFENKILFKVDNEIITTIDLLNEIEYLEMLNNNLKDLPDKKLYEIAKNSLIKEKIRKIETSKLNLIKNDEVDYTEIFLNEFVKKINLNSKQDLKTLLKKKSLKIENIVEKIKIEVLWNELIVNKFSKSVKINPDEIKKEILKNNIQKKYFLSEIVFNLDNEKINNKFNKIKNEIEKNGFKNAASIYSIADTAKAGGKVGWVKINSLNDVLKKEIIKINEGEYTNPIVIPGGFIILKIDDIETESVIKDIDEEVKNISNIMINKQLNQFSNIYFKKIKKETEINEL